MKIQRFIKKCLKGIQFFLLLLIGGAYVWVITFLAKNDNWVGISALTTMLLAIAAFWAIWDRREQEKRDRKEHRLNEIIEWAVEILKCRPTLDIELRIELEALGNQRKLEDLLVDDTRWKFNAIKGDGIYIKRIASRFGQDLQNAVDVVSEKLVLQTKLLEQVSEGRSTLSGAAENRESLNESAIDLIDKAVNLLFNSS